MGLDLEEGFFGMGEGIEGTEIGGRRERGIGGMGRTEEVEKGEEDFEDGGGGMEEEGRDWGRRRN
jgi:hypothetical protein